MSCLKHIAHKQTRRLTLALGLPVLALLPTLQSPAYPISGVTVRDDAPFQGANGPSPLTSVDGLLSVAGWADTSATVTANLYQWNWILGVDSGVGNGALLDGRESMTLRFDSLVGCSHICFFNTGQQGSPTTPAQITISGFLSDPRAYVAIYNSPRISNLKYSGGVLTFDYLYDFGTDYGQLLFANPAASRGRTLKILYGAGNWGAGLFRVDSQELFGGPMLQPYSVKHGVTNSYTTPDGGLTVRGYSNSGATVPANLGTYVDLCFGVYGGNKSAIDGTESVKLQFAPGMGLARLETVYGTGTVTISGFRSDPGFNDLGYGSLAVTYGGGVLSFQVADPGHHIYFFTNRTASAGQTLRVNSDGGSGSFPIAGVGYVDLRTLIAGDIPNNMSSTYSTADRLLTLNGYLDTPGTVPENLSENVDWFGVTGGANTEAIEGTESLGLQFSGGFGLSSFGTRYTSGGVVISGFDADPGFTDPSGLATGVNFAAGALSFTFNSGRSPEVVFKFSNVAASAGRTLSLHTDGNAGSQIALTRINYAAVPKLSIARYGNHAVLSWAVGTLQQSANVTGAYLDLSSATSPYTNPISGAPKFFRLKL